MTGHDLLKTLQKMSAEKLNHEVLVSDSSSGAIRNASSLMFTWVDKCDLDMGMDESYNEGDPYLCLTQGD